MILLFPSDYFEKNQVDSDLKEEYQAAVQTGLYEIILFDYEKFFHENQLVLSQKPHSSGIGIYRGWMMKPEQYAFFYQELLKQQIQLLNSPQQYRKLHLFPELYPVIQEDTARILLYPLHQQLQIQEILKQFDRFLIKDSVKSLKDPRFPNCFDKNTSQAALDEYMQNFYQFRGELLTGDICVKEYLKLKYYQNHTNEYRVFYAGGNLLSVCRNSGQPEDTAIPPEWLLRKYQHLESSYYTVDFAELSDSSWKILECGDGGVSGLAQTEDFRNYYHQLYTLVQNL